MMIESVQISFSDVPRSDALEALINKEAQKLERFFDGIIFCRVRVFQAYKRQAMPFGVHIEIGVPGDTIVVHDDPNPHTEQEHRDAQRAIRDAFRTAGRRLEEYAKLKRAPRV